MSKVVPVNRFKKQYKKVKRDPRWHKIFNGKVPFEDDNRSPWRFIIDCFTQDQKIPSYFYEHPLVLSRAQKQQIFNRIPNDLKDNISILGLDLHFDGHNGDHLLLYVRTNKGIVYLTGIGTHSDLF